MTRAKISTHKGVAEETFTPAHVTIVASDLADLSESSIMNKVGLGEFWTTVQHCVDSFILFYYIDMRIYLNLLVALIWLGVKSQLSIYLNLSKSTQSAAGL